MDTRAKWERRVARWKASGLTAAEFAAGRGYSPATLKWWSSRLGPRGLPDAVGSAVPLARVVVRDEPAAVAETAETPVVLELEQLRIAVRRGFDPEVLRQVLMVARGETT